MENKKALNTVKYIFLALVAVVIIFPLLFLLMSSFKTNEELFTSTFSLPQNPQFMNYVRVFSEFHLERYFFNSLFYAAVVCVAGAVIDSMAAYAIARMRWKLSNITMKVLLLGIMIPLHAIIVPLYIFTSRLHIPNQTALMLLFIASTIPTSVFLVTGFLANVPRAVEESAVMDGCSVPRMFYRIICPIISPAIATVTIFNFMGVWNDLLLSLIFLTDETTKTLQLGIMRFKTSFFTEYGLLLTAIVVSMVPSIIVYLFMSERLISGITAGAVKG